MSSDSDPLIKPYVSLSLPSNDGLVSSVPVMVLFTSLICNPCRQILPTLSELDLEYKDQFKFYTFDVDEEKEPKIITKRYDIRTFPSTNVFKRGGPMIKYYGFDPEELKQLVEKYK
ncbi:unnamed protein product [Arabidopsis halleri]